MTARTNTSTSLFREACRAELRAASYTARHAARKPSRWTAAIAAAGAAGAITAAAGAGPWSSAATSLAADTHGASASGHASSVQLTARNQAALRLPDGGGSQATAQPATSATSHPAQATPASASERSTAVASAATGPRHAAKHAARHASAAASSTTTSSSPSTIYDSVVPSAIPTGQHVATYSNGPYQASSSDVAGRGKVLWIDTNGSNPKADALDVEPGDATPAGAAAWVSAKLTKSPSSNAIVYTFKADWGQVTSNISKLPSWMQSHVKYWIADPTGSAHILPGAAATQWYWGQSYDITSASAGFFG